MVLCFFLVKALSEIQKKIMAPPLKCSKATPLEKNP